MNKDTQIKLSAQAAIIAGVFSILISLLLLINYWQSVSHDPLESAALQSLVERLADDPQNDALREEIRSFDLLARKAFFTTQWQVKTGGYLLLFGAIVFVVAVQSYFSLTSKIEKPGTDLVGAKTQRILSQKWILVFGVVIMLMALGSALLSKNYFNSYESSQQASVAPSSSPQTTTQVEVVDISVDSSNVMAEEQETMVEDAGAPALSFPSREEVMRNHGGFRGPFSNGIIYHTNIPVEWDGATNKNIKWKIPLPKEGNNSPVLWGNKLFFAGVESDVFTIYCLDRNTGNLIWQKDVTNVPGSPATMPRVTDDTGFSAPTLATDGQRVFGIFATGDLICFDMDGNRLWAKNLGVPENHYGHASSLICWQDKLYVQYDTGNGGRLIALQVQSGDIEWQTFREVEVSWASPILAQINGTYQVILVADPFVAGYNAQTGAELWSFEEISGEVGPSAAYSDGLVFAVNEYAKLVAIDPVNRSVVWEDNEYLADCSSPVVSNGLVFVATSYGIVACYDAKTGEKYWEHQCNTGFMSSPVVVENKVYITDWDGVTTIFALSKDLQVLGEPELGETVYGTPAFADGSIYFKSLEHLFCISEE